MCPISPSVELLTMQVMVLRATGVIHYMCSLKVIFKKALKNQCIMKQPPNVSSEGRWLWADWGLNGLTSCTFTEIVIWTGHNKGKNYCSPKRSKKIRAHTSSIAVSTQILITHGWQSIISLYSWEKCCAKGVFRNPKTRMSTWPSHWPWNKCWGYHKATPGKLPEYFKEW